MNNSICSRPWLIVFLFAKRKAEKEKETKRKVLVYQLFAEVDVVDQNDVNQKVRETVLQRF